MSSPSVPAVDSGPRRSFQRLACRPFRAMYSSARVALPATPILPIPATLASSALSSHSAPGRAMPAPPCLHFPGVAAPCLPLQSARAFSDVPAVLSMHCLTRPYQGSPAKPNHPDHNYPGQQYLAISCHSLHASPAIPRLPNGAAPARPLLASVASSDHATPATSCTAWSDRAALSMNTVPARPVPASDLHTTPAIHAWLHHANHSRPACPHHAVQDTTDHASNAVPCNRRLPIHPGHASHTLQRVSRPRLASSARPCSPCAAMKHLPSMP